MTKLPLLSEKTYQEASVSLPSCLLRDSVNTHMLYLAVKRDMAHARLGSANTKTRSEIAGGGRKPWKQKGTGRARAGSIRSPLWRGGGVIFGPQPRKFQLTLSRKVRQSARLQALASAVSKSVVLDGFASVAQPKTALMAKLLKQLPQQPKSVLLIYAPGELNVSQAVLAVRNLPGVQVQSVQEFSVQSVLAAQCVLLTQAALSTFGEEK